MLCREVEIDRLIGLWVSNVFAFKIVMTYVKSV